MPVDVVIPRARVVLNRFELVEGTWNEFLVLVRPHGLSRKNTTQIHRVHHFAHSHVFFNRFPLTIVRERRNDVFKVFRKPPESHCVLFCYKNSVNFKLKTRCLGAFLRG